MPSDCTYIPYQDTNSFSKLAVDYVAGHPVLKEFFTFSADLQGLKKAIEARKNFPVNRTLLVTTLEKQYAELTISDSVKNNIERLKEENTFTVCTAHQPNLLTGYLYFVYKILHAIKLADELSKAFPDKHFVPVYYIGSEDNDLDELGVFRYNGEKYSWNAAGQTGAVGRMNTESLKDVFDNLFRKMGPPGAFYERLKELIENAYLKTNTIAKATQYLVNELFGKYGLVVLDPDETALKAAFIEVMKDDLLQGKAEKLVTAQIEKLAVHYKSQAHPRSINLFYLQDQLRERIEKNGATWKVLNTDITFDETSLLNELQNHPERFSPNVVLRGLFQETILPDVAFIGGGAEVAYWLQLKTVFEHYQVFYPAIFLRQSVMLLTDEAEKRRAVLGLSLQELFLNKEALIKNYFLSRNQAMLNIDDEAFAIQELLEAVKTKAKNIDPTLATATDAAMTKTNRQLNNLRIKMLRAEKKKHTVTVERIEKLKSLLFPNGGLQERVENFIEYYLLLGDAYFDSVIQGIEPLRNEFLILKAVQ